MVARSGRVCGREGGPCPADSVSEHLALPAGSSNGGLVVGFKNEWQLERVGRSPFSAIHGSLPGQEVHVGQDYIDFAYYRLHVSAVYFIRGFGVMGWISAEDYGSALPDPLAKAVRSSSMDTPTTFSSPGGYDFASRTRPWGFLAARRPLLGQPMRLYLHLMATLLRSSRLGLSRRLCAAGCYLEDSIRNRE